MSYRAIFIQITIFQNSSYDYGSKRFAITVPMHYCSDESEKILQEKNEARSKKEKIKMPQALWRPANVIEYSQ